MIETALAICFLGDSITRGAIGGFLPPTVVVEQQLHVRAINHGVSGATTWDWLPGGRLLETAKVTCRYDGARIMSIMLGTNDGFRRTGPWQYRENLIEITNDLTDAGFTVVLNYPAGSLRKDFQQWRADEYGRQIETVGAIVGDRTATRLLRNRWLLLPDESHPTDLGAQYLGEAWATALSAVVSPGTQSTDRSVSLVP